MGGKLTQLEKHWVLYDIGNSAFILLATTLMPIFFNSLAKTSGLNESEYLAYWGYAGSIVTVLVAIIGPVCGALADRKGFKKPIFMTCMLLGAVICAFLGAAWSWLAFLILFVISKVGYSAANVFYDAMLPEITTSERMDMVSSVGYAYGYIGSVIPFVLCLGLVLCANFFGITQGTAMVFAFVITAIWWAVCTVPLMKTYQQTAYAEHGQHPVADAFRQLYGTFRNARKQQHIFLYLLAFFFFIDGVYTIISMATAYGTALGLDSTGLLLALLVTQIVAFPCAILFGRLSGKYDTGLLIKVCIICYTGITLFAVFLQTQWQFWILAVLVGMFQGGIQALSRSYLAKIIPPEQSGEYFGLMEIFGKGASFLGTMLVSTISQATAGVTICVFGTVLQNESIAVGTLVILFAVGLWIFCVADKLNREQRA